MYRLPALSTATPDGSDKPEEIRVLRVCVARFHTSMALLGPDAM